MLLLPPPGDPTQAPHPRPSPILRHFQPVHQGQAAGGGRATPICTAFVPVPSSSAALLPLLHSSSGGGAWRGGSQETDGGRAQAAADPAGQSPAGCPDIQGPPAGLPWSSDPSAGLSESSSPFAGISDSSDIPAAGTFPEPSENEITGIPGLPLHRTEWLPEPPTPSAA